MDKQYYDYTLQFAQSVGDDLLAAQEGYVYLKSLPDGHADKSALTPEMESAYKALVASCEEFIRAYSYYSKK